MKKLERDGEWNVCICGNMLKCVVIAPFGEIQSRLHFCDFFFPTVKSSMFCATL